MKRVYPNLKKHDIVNMSFRTVLKGNVKAIKRFWERKGFGKNIGKGYILIFKEYFYNKMAHLVALRIDFPTKQKKQARLYIDLATKFKLKRELQKFKPLLQDDFLDFFKWLNKYKQIKTNKISLLAHCHLPLKDNLMFPPPIKLKSEKAVFPVGIRFGFNKKMEIETVIIEKTRNKKKPLHFMIKTLKRFDFDEKYFNEKFFNSPIEFLQKMVLIFCGKKTAGKE